MNHLTSEQISKVIAGMSIPEELHIRECAVCASEVKRALDAIVLFRGSVREWTGNREHSAFPSSAAIVRSRKAPLAWLLAAAALALAVVVPLYENAAERQSREQAARDVELTDEVNAHLSRQAPAAMQPLMQLMKETQSYGGNQ